MNNHSKITNSRQLQETLAAEVSREGLELLITIGVPVYLVSEEYAGLPVEDRRDIMSAIIGLWEVSRRIDGYISAA